MDTDFRTSWLKMGVRKLEAHLRDQGYPPPMIDNIMSRVQTEKYKARIAKIKGTVLQQAWDSVLKPARAEIGITRTMIAQTKAQQRQTPDNNVLQVKIDTYTRYANLLAVLIEKFRAVQRAGEETPQQFAKTLRKAGKMPTDGDGTHWVDYVSPKKRHEITLEFERLPAAKRGKTKTPFERRTSFEDNYRARQTLGKAIASELGTVERELELPVDSFTKEELERKFQRLHHAQFNLEQLSRTAPVPSTWHGLLKDE
jgi:hypothetical protein